MLSQHDYAPFGNELWQGGNATERRSWIGKEQDNESELGDFGVRKYDEDLGRFLSVDALWEKYTSSSPYLYVICNPFSYTDSKGLDSAQRALAVAKANEYEASGSTYKLGKKGEPGDTVDCSELVSSCIVAAGNLIL